MRRTLSFIMALCMTLTLTACGKGGEAGPAGSGGSPAGGGSGGDAPMVLSQYSQEYYPFPGGTKTLDVARQGGKLLFLGRSEAGYALALADHSTDENGFTVIASAQALSLEAAADSAQAVVYDIAAGGDGLFYVLTGSSQDSYTGDFHILRYTPEGQFQDKMSITGFPEQAPEYLMLAAGSQGEMALAGFDYMYFLTWGGQPANRQAIERANFTCAASTDKGIILSVYNLNLSESPFFLMDSQTGAISRLNITNPADPAQDMEGFKMIWGGSNCLVQGLEGEFIGEAMDKFLLFDFDADQVQQLLEWNYTGASMLSACRVSQQGYVCALADSEAVLLCGMAYMPSTEKSQVRVAVVGAQADGVISRMNHEQQVYEYTAAYFDSSQARSFLSEISAGAQYDLVLFTNDLNTANAYYDDLYPYIDADPDLSRESFLPNLLESTQVNGQLHQLWDQTAVSTLTSWKKMVGDGKGLTTQDCVDKAAEGGRLKAVFDTFMSSDTLLAYVAQISASVFVDKEQGQARFDDPAFAQLLSWCQAMSANATEDGSGGLVYELDEYLLTPAYVNAPVSSLYNEQIGDDMVFVGFPNGGDGYHYYRYFNNYGLSMAIPANSQNKDGAWAFIKARLSLDSQLDLGDMSGLPVLYEAYQRRADVFCTKDSRAAMDDLLSRTVYAESYSDSELQSIINSAGQAYLAGDQSLEETVQLIQSRASIYVAEQYGDGRDMMYELMMAVDGYNKSQSQVTVQLVDYAKYDTVSEQAGRDRLNTDIISGKTPDIYDLSCFGQTDLSRNGLLEDLKPFFDADGDFPTSSLIPSALSALEVQGSLYSFIPSFRILTTAVGSSTVQDAFTFEQLRELVEEHSLRKVLGPEMTRDKLLSYVLYFMADEIYSTQDASCSFDSDTFVNILSWMAQLPQEQELFEGSISLPLGSAAVGELMVLIDELGIDPANILASDAVLPGGANYTGFPSQAGGGFALIPGLELGMSSTSQNKEAVWDFFKYLLMRSSNSTRDIPMVQAYAEEGLDRQINIISEKVKGMTPNSPQGYVTIFFQDFDKAQLREQAWDIIQSINCVTRYDQAVYDIIHDQCQAMFAGNASPEATAAQIQSRVSIYLAEQYG